jgi:hypothetical protein
VANNLAVFDTYTPNTRTIDTADSLSTALGTGTVNLRLLRSDSSIREVVLHDVTYMPKCPVNLFGARKLMKEGRGYILLGQLILYTCKERITGRVKDAMRDQSIAKTKVTIKTIA